MAEQVRDGEGASAESRLRSRARPGEEAYELVTVLLTDLGDDRTEMRFEQQGHMTPAQYSRAEQGWRTFVERLAERLRNGP